MTDNHHDSDSVTAGRVKRVEAAVIAAGLTTEAELDLVLEVLATKASPRNGARVVARAWVDRSFAEAVLADANAAIEKLGLSMETGPKVRLKAVANSESVHNVVVCTLCSCYPVGLLGPPPTWYKEPAYRSRVVREPRAVLAEFGTHLPPQTEIRVWDSSAETRYLVISRRPERSDGLDEDGLAGLVTRNGLIGTAIL
jgi:nitrile hydratase subunit alpha